MHHKLAPILHDDVVAATPLPNQAGAAAHCGMLRKGLAFKLYRRILNMDLQSSILSEF